MIVLKINSENLNIIDFLINNKDKSDIRDYVLENGKEGKPFCPIMFVEKEKDDGNKIN